MPTAHWQRLAGQRYDVLGTLEKVDDAIDANAEIAEAIADSGYQTFGSEAMVLNEKEDWHGSATASDLDKARSTIRQLYRDWSEEGFNERDQAQRLVLSAMQQAFIDRNDRSSVRVLVPGAGLGRLVFELCMEGYTVEGNEISYHQLLASNWILNHTEMPKQFKLFPFALDFSNVLSRKQQLKSVDVPDAHAGSELQAPRTASQLNASERMSMTAADFVVLYSDDAHHEAYQAVATVFFVDTAPNIIRYIQAIYNCLEENGIWVNYGPLLWHFAERGPPGKSESNNDHDASGRDKKEKIGIEEPGGVELSNEELLLLVEDMGFHLEESFQSKEGHGYIQNPASMLQNTYRPSYWVARKTSR